ncbi:unnamed protein product [Withania somnifera]
MATGLKALPFSLGAHFIVPWWLGLAWEADNKKLIFNIHPVLMLIGFIILGGEAIMSYKSFPLEKQVKKVIHLVLHAIALILGIVGVYTAFKNHNESSIPNMYSLHSWWIYGFVVFFYPGGSSEIRRDSLPWHVLFGMFVYVMAVGNACLGFLEKITFVETNGLAKYGSEAFLVNFTALSTVVYGVFVFLTILSQAPTADDHIYSAIS